jgi:hypothetical protein
MGSHIEVAAMLDAAGRFDAAAATLDRTGRGRATFGAAAAGRAHVAHGDAVRAGVDRLSDDLRAWARAGAETAAVLRASADRYVEADARATARLS